jgi:hypothetical protein
MGFVRAIGRVPPTPYRFSADADDPLGLRPRLGRRTSSPPQFGQTPLSAFAQVAQKVHSKLHM